MPETMDNRIVPKKFTEAEIAAMPACCQFGPDSASYAVESGAEWLYVNYLRQTGGLSYTGAACPTWRTIFRAWEDAGKPDTGVPAAWIQLALLTGFRHPVMR